MPRESGASSIHGAWCGVRPVAKPRFVVTGSPAFAGDDGCASGEHRDSSMTIALPAQPSRRLVRFDMSWPIRGLVAVVLVVLIVLPMSWLVYFSVTDKSGALRFDNFVQLFTDPVFLEPLGTTLLLATGSAAICCLVAAPIGWLVARTDMPLRRFVRALVTASFVTPPFLGAIAWELLAAPNSGLLHKIFRPV